MARLRRLLDALPHKEVHGDVEVDIIGLAHDSRQVRPGDLFVAIKGLTTDGHNYIPEALQKGAVAVVAEREPGAIPGFPSFPLIIVPDSRAALAFLAAALYGFPSRLLRLIGVTGTDGKTTTVNLIASILRMAGYRTGLISTVNAVIGEEVHDTGLHTTTPDAHEIQHYLAQMVEAETEYAVLEATSHGLAQHRVTACDFDVAVITNITHEHLDYHGTFEDYREAKAMLFRALNKSFRKPGVPKVAILNADDPSFAYFRAIPADVHLSYGLGESAQVRALDIVHSPQGLAFTVVSPAGEFPIRSPLVGCFNVYNILAAVAAALSQDIPFQAIQQGVEAVKGVVGRMERVDLGQDFTVIIDFAHTPNGLEQALHTVREMTSGRVIVVFGCAGLRDTGKRPMMGEIAGHLADLIVLTAEDPRTEDVNDIIDQIAVGCEKAGRREGLDYWRVPDRAEAIERAVKMALPGDLVIVTGKGHERSMCYGTVEYPWSEHEAVEKALRKVLKGRGPGGAI